MHHITLDAKRQDSLNAVEQKLQRLTLPTANSSHSQIMFSVDQMGAGGSAIAAAASQAIAATQQVFAHFVEYMLLNRIFNLPSSSDATWSSNHC